MLLTTFTTFRPNLYLTKYLSTKYFFTFVPGFTPKHSCSVPLLLLNEWMLRYSSTQSRQLEKCHLRRLPTKAYFPLGDFIREMRSENKNPATWLVKIGWRKNLPRTSWNCSYFFACLREQIRQVENRFNSLPTKGLRSKRRFFLYRFR